MRLLYKDVGTGSLPEEPVHKQAVGLCSLKLKVAHI